MKRLSTLFVVLAAIVLAITGCKSKTQKNGADSTATDSAAIGKDTLVVDSMSFSSACNDSSVQCFICVDYPYGSDSLSLAVKEFIGSELAALFLPYNNEEDDVARKYPKYKGSVLKGQQMVDHYGQGTIKYFCDSQKSTMQEMGWGEEDRPSLSLELNIRKTDETTKYVTYRVTEYVDLGGAHPSYSTYCVNISKLANKPLEQTVDTTKVKAVQKILGKGVLSYLKFADESVTAKNYRDQLILPANGMIPLPVHAPYLEGDSLCFVYQQYEITPYALGLVSFEVACKDIKDYLCKDASELLGSGK